MTPIPLQPAPAAHLPTQFIRFAAVGAATTAVQYAVLWLGMAAASAPAAVASAAGYALGVLLSYVLNYAFTFRSSTPHLEAAPKYFAVFGVGWCINLAMMAMLVHRWGWSAWPAQVLTTAVGLVWNFSASRWWAFRHDRER